MTVFIKKALKKQHSRAGNIFDVRHVHLSWRNKPGRAIYLKMYPQYIEDQWINKERLDASKGDFNVWTRDWLKKSLKTDRKHVTLLLSSVHLDTYIHIIKEGMYCQKFYSLFLETTLGKTQTKKNQQQQQHNPHSDPWNSGASTLALSHHFQA